MIPEGAPFSPEQRSWLNGFFAGLLSLDATAGAAALDGAMPDAAAKALGGEDDGAPWHDAAMPIAERMTLAEGKPLPRKLFAAMAQQDCGQCGYLCETYSQGHRRGQGGQAQPVRARRQGNEPHAQASPGRGAWLRRSPARARSRARRAEGARSRARAMRPCERCSCPRRGSTAKGPRRIRAMLCSIIAGSGLSYAPGDSFGLFPTNDPALADAVLAALRVPARLSRRRQADPRRADRGLRARPRARHAVRADELSGRRRAAAEGEAAGQGRRSRRRRGHARRAGRAGEVRAGASRSRSVRGVPGAAAAAPLFHRLVPACDAGPAASHGGQRALRHRRSAAARRRLDVPGRSRGAGRARQGLHPEGARLRAAQGWRSADHHGRPRHGRRAVPLVPVASQGDQGDRSRLAVLRPPARGDRLLLSRRVRADAGRQDADPALDGLVARRRRQGLRAGPHARGRARAVVLAEGRRAFLRVRRRASAWPRMSRPRWSRSPPRPAR